MFAILALIAIDLYVLKSTGVAQKEKPERNNKKINRSNGPFTVRLGVDGLQSS